MADYIRMQINNAQAVQNALNAFEKKISQKVVRQGVRAAWTPLLKRARANAQSMISGSEGKKIAKALKLKVFKKKAKGRYGMHVSISVYGGDVYYVGGAHSLVNVSTGKPGKEVGRYYIPAAIEFGHAFPGRGGTGAKDVPARPFMRKALDVTLPNAPKIFEKHLVHAIHEENKKK